MEFFNNLLGVPVTSGAISSLIISASMVLGVLVTGIMFLTASSAVGWLVGTVIDVLTANLPPISGT